MSPPPKPANLKLALLNSKSILLGKLVPTSSTSFFWNLTPDIFSGTDRKILTDVSTELSILINAILLSKAVSSWICESACLNSSVAPDAHVAYILALYLIKPTSY